MLSQSKLTELYYTFDFKSILFALFFAKSIGKSVYFWDFYLY